MTEVEIHYGLTDDEFAAVVQATRQADEAFEKEGGGTRHWLREQFLPELDAAGFRIVALAALAAAAARTEGEVVLS